MDPRYEARLDRLNEDRENARCCEREIRLARTAADAADWTDELRQVQASIRRQERSLLHPERAAAAIRRLAEMRSRAAARELAAQIEHAARMTAAMGPSELSNMPSPEEIERLDDERANSVPTGYYTGIVGQTY